MPDKTVITASCLYRGNPVKDVPVINPAAVEGRTWLMVVEKLDETFLFIVEAVTQAEAIETLVEDEIHGVHLRVADEDRGVYGRYDYQNAAWYDLNEKMYHTNPHLNEADETSKGTFYDSEGFSCYNSLYRSGGYEARYHGVYKGHTLPENGLTPSQVHTLSLLEVDNLPHEIDASVEDCFVRGFQRKYNTYFDAVKVIRHNSQIVNLLAYKNDAPVSEKGIVDEDIPEALEEAIKCLTS